MGSAIGTLISIPLSFLLAGLLLPMADWIKTHSDIVLAAGAVVLALLVGVVCGSLNRLGVAYGVQFMSLYAAPGIVKALAALA